MMRIRALWLAVPACAAAGVMGVNMVGAQESAPRATVRPVTVKPDTGAATSMFGPPPPSVVVSEGNTRLPTTASRPVAPDTRAANGTFGSPNNSGVKPVSASEPPPLFFPNASPPPKVETPTLPAPRILIESNTPTEPKPLPIVPPIATTPTIPAPVPSGPQPLVPSTPPAIPVAPSPAPATFTPMMPKASTSALPFPTMALTPKQTPCVVIECLAPESISVGQSLEYVLVVKNTGTSAVANVRVEDELPTAAKFMTSEPAAEQNGDRLAWNLGTLDAGGEKRIKITVKPSDEGELRSRAMVTFTGAAEARVKVTRPKIAVALTGMESARVGDEVPFQIKVTNTGSGAATNLLVKAKLSDGLHHPAGGQIEALVDRLPPGESKVITLRAMATKAGSNGCSISATSEGMNVETANANVAVVEPMLTAKLAGPARCLVRTEPEFKIELANPGTASTDPVQVWAVIPEGFEFASASDAGTFQAANRLVVWSLPGLAMNTNRTLSMKLKTSAAAEGTIKIVAQSAPPAETGVVTAGAKTSATRMIEVKAEATVKAQGVPALKFEVADVEDPVEVGKEAIYDIKVVNQGTASCTNVVVTATLADGTVVTGATGATTARGQGQAITFDALPLLAVKGEAVYRVKVRGSTAGDLKIKIAVSCDEIRTPTVKEENTRFFKD